MKLRALRDFIDLFDAGRKFKVGQILEVEDWVRAGRLLNSHSAEEYQGEEEPSCVLAIPDDHRRIRETLNDRLSQNMIPIAGYDYPFSMNRFQLSQEEYAAIKALRLEDVQCEGTPQGAFYPFFTRKYEYFTTNRNGSWQDDGGTRDLLFVLNKLTGRKLRLPTINEWEFVASNGGKDQSLKCEKPVLHEIGAGEPNEMGVYDMLGNGRQLCYLYGGYQYPDVIAKGNYDVLSNYFSVHDDRYNTSASPASIRLVESEKPLTEIHEQHKELEEQIGEEKHAYEEDMHYWWEN